MESNREKKTLAFILPGVPPIPSKAVFQRPLAFSKEFNIHVIAAQPVCQDISLKVKSVSICPVKIKFLNRLIVPFWATYKAFQIKRKFGLDAVLAAYPNWTLIAGIICKAFGIPFIADMMDVPEHWLHTHGDTPGILASLGRMYHMLLLGVIKKYLYKADFVICVGSRDRYVKEYNIDKTRAIEVTNGVNIAGIPNCLSYTKDDSSRPAILYVGHLRKEKNIGTILRAFKMLKEDNIDCELRLVGPIESHSSIWFMSELKSLSLHEDVVATGELDHSLVWKEICQAQVCIYPFPPTHNLEYVSPIKLFEYMGAGKPVVSSDLPGARKIIEDGISGFLVPPEDPSAFARRIRDILIDSSLRARIGASAAQRIRLFDWNIINSNIIYHIKKVLDDIHQVKAF